MKRIKIYLQLSFFFFVFVIVQCKLPDTLYDLKIENNSNLYLHYYLATDFLCSTTVYPDTLLPVINNCINYIVKPHEKYVMEVSYVKYDKYIKQLPYDTLSIFIFSKDTLDKYGWPEVQSKYKILRRYDLSSEDIKVLKDIIPYPPSEKMKDMKMYPLYK